MKDHLTLVAPGPDDEDAAHLRGRLGKLSDRAEALATKLGGRRAAERLEPSNETLAVLARDRRISLLPFGWLLTVAVVYYAAVIGLAISYGLVLGSLQNWEGWLQIIGPVAVAVAFIGVSVGLLSVWKHLAIAKYRENAKTFGRVRSLTVGFTAGVLIVDFVAAYVLLAGELEAASLGASQVPRVVVPLIAALTLFSQALGAFLGHQMGLRHEMRTCWWSGLLKSRSEELDELHGAAIECKRIRERLADLERLPPGHIDRAA